MLRNINTNILLFEYVLVHKCLYCGEPAISLHSHHISLVQWTTRLLTIMRDPGSIPRGVLMWNRDSPVSYVKLHWWLQHDWSLWPHLRRASPRTVTRPSCRQCDNPTWSHTALLSRFHACCRSSFWLHSWHSRLLRESPVASLQSHCIHTMSHWSSETGILLLVLSRCNMITGIRGLGTGRNLQTKNPDVRNLLRLSL